MNKSTFSNIQNIPDDTEVIFVADLFVHEYAGGAELTSEVYITSCPKKIHKLNSKNLSVQLVEQHKDKLWVLGNWTMAPISAVAQLVVSKCKYVVIEYDYKICKYRSPQLHQIKEGIQCNCLSDKNIGMYGRFVDNFYASAKHVFFMSEKQAEYYKSNTTLFRKRFEHGVQVVGSAWSDEDLNYILSLHNKRTSDKFAVLTGGSWIKNQTGAEQFCMKNNIPYELVGNLPYKEFLKKLSTYAGLVFLPAGFDTAPRIVIEAKLMGLSLVVNDFVQHREEAWFVGPHDDMVSHVKSRKDSMWSLIYNCC